MSSGVAGHLCIGKPLSWLVLYSARFVETLKVKATSLKVKATSLYNTRARERWARSLLLSFSAAPFCLISNTIFPYPPRRFTLSPTPFYLIRHTILPYPPRHFCLISNTILPYPPRRFTLSPTPFYLTPTPFYLIPHAVLPYPPHHFALSATPFCLIPHAILPYLQHHFALSPTSFHLIPKAIFSPFHLFIFSPFHLFTPSLTTANILVLRILAPRKPIVMQQMRWCFLPIDPISQCGLSQTTT